MCSPHPHCSPPKYRRVNSSHTFWSKVASVNSIIVCSVTSREARRASREIECSAFVYVWSLPVFQASFPLKRISGAQSGLDFDVVLGGLSIFFAFGCILLDTTFGRALPVVVRLGFSNEAAWLSHLVQRETLTKLCSPAGVCNFLFRTSRVRWEAFSHHHCNPTALQELQNSIAVRKILHPQSSNQSWLSEFRVISQSYCHTVEKW